MITAELRNALTLVSEEETFDLPSFEAFDSVLPLPMWRDIVRGELRYQCPVARLLAAQNHLDGKFVASHWQELMLYTREKTALDFAGERSPKSSDGSYLAIPDDFSFLKETRLEQEGSLLSWTFGEQGLRRWLTVGASSSLWGSGWATENSHLYGSTKFHRQRTAEREFRWQYSFVRSYRVMKLLEEARRKRVNESLPEKERESLKAFPRKRSGILGAPAWDALLPLILAQMSLVDAMALAPQYLVSAADQLSSAWVSWLSIQVLNDLRLSQMADASSFAAVAVLNHNLIGLAIRAVFNVDPVEQL